ncbi:hypothetical protein [Photorhabdus akhurstii]|uniref:AbrB/MazE/SpoVT family DNA-binding domain-containing protein n=1 Tax=Photorhabdus akhurstii TaxID=171438 RepID=UPI001C2E1575|nr:hypothetical protein [Photorhabdus akhurstii]
MHTTRLKRVGGSVMLTVPPYKRPQYSLAELLAQCDPDAEISAEDREWLDAPAVGREAI